MSIVDTIKTRRSVRTYMRKPITEAHWRGIESELNAFAKQYGVKLALLKNSLNGKKYGTYGIIRDPDAFIAVVCKNEKHAILQAGMALEKIVLHCTALGLGTCWLGGTFKRDEFGSALTVAEGEMIPAVISVGYPMEKERLLNNLMRWGAKSDKRIPFEELFFGGEFNRPLTKDDSPEGLALEMVRLAPSASNKQPWRIVKVDDAYHFYLAHTPGYGKGLPYDIQVLDIGIAMTHFELAINQCGGTGHWISSPVNIGNLPENVEYMASWVI